MPKRDNPFGDGSPLQFKSHISQKEVDLGISADINMKAVYDHTMALLFRGAQKAHTIPSDVPNTSNNSPVTGLLVIYPPGQLCFDQQGQLTPPSALGFQTLNNNNNNNNSSAACGSASGQCQGDLAKTVNPRLCHSCHCALSSALSSSSVLCSFCDHAVCSGCQRQCERCDHLFCTLCSVINYDDPLESAYCLSCAM